MNRINGLSDDVLVKILLFLLTKAAVSTSILSKRWEHLWMWLPKLEFDDTSYSEPECKRLECFLDRNLPLLKAPVIESLCLKFSKLQFEPKDVKLDKDFDLDGFVINTPSLKYFKLEDHIWEYHSCLIENMPKLREAYVDVVVDEFSGIKGLIRSIKSVKSLSLCVKYIGIEAVCDDGFVFNELEHLKLCVCQNFDLLVQFLNHSPKLRELNYFVMRNHCIHMENHWSEPSMIPECILWDVQIFNWSPYCGSPEERNLAVYILKNARRLRTATFLADDDFVPKLQMIKELAFSSRASTTCQLTFDS